MGRRKALVVLRAFLLAAVLPSWLVACGGETSGGGSSSEVSATEHNDADVEFASAMLQHHAQALSMVDLARGRPLDPEVQKLADRIREVRAPEIEVFNDWLTEWGEEIPETMRDHVNAGHDMGDVGSAMEGMGAEVLDLPGMMTAEEMVSLQTSADAEFESKWLAMMVEHHSGAVEMAKAEQEGGQYKPAVVLAGDIAEAQSAEIEVMEGLLG